MEFLSVLAIIFRTMERIRRVMASSGMIPINPSPKVNVHRLVVTTWNSVSSKTAPTKEHLENAPLRKITFFKVASLKVQRSKTQEST